MSSTKKKYVQVVILALIVIATALVWIHSQCETSIVDAIPQAVTPKTMESEECPVDAILCGQNIDEGTAKTTQDYNALRSTFYRLMTSIEFQCPSTKRFGREGDGGYEACMWKAIRPNNQSCLVYSFGISVDWSFDDDVAKYGCEVHSFDPSIGKEDHLHAPNVHFHNLGLWGTDYVNSKGWKLARLSTIMKKLGHENRTIDVLKIDVEGAEWPFLRDTVYTEPSVLSSVKQLFVELHSPKFRPQIVTRTDFAEINIYVKRLRDKFGFRLFKNVQSNDCCGRFSDLMPHGIPERCCHEVFFFNSNLVSKKT